MNDSKLENEFVPKFVNLSIEELDKSIEDNVLDHERAERLICFALLEMSERRGYEKFGFSTIVDYAHGRFQFRDGKTYHLLRLARRIKDLPQIAQALAEGKIGWTKAYHISKVAKQEDEVMWLESAMSMSVRELEQRIKRKLDDVVTKLRLWLTEDQSSVWEFAVEVCQRTAGANLSHAQCLEYMAGEFIATWAYEATHEEAPCPNAETEQESDSPDGGESKTQEMDDAELLDALGRACPENDDLPNPGNIPLNKVFRAAMERDSYTCSYPGCSARAKLHPHHIEYRSHFGGKSQRQCHSLSNICTVCVFHHRQLHAGVIDVRGKAPFDLDWRKPKLTDTAMMRMERRRMELARKRKKKKKTRPEPESGVHTCAVEPDYATEDETYDFNELIDFLRAQDDELKKKGALRMDAEMDWDAETTEDITPDELEFLLQTFALDGEGQEEGFGDAC
jgi:hypothetical protein